MGRRCVNISSANKRASLSPTQRPRNEFCSTPGRRATRTTRRTPLAFGPRPGKGSDFDSDAVRLGIDVRLRRADPHRFDPAEGGDPIEDRVRQGFLKVVTASRGDLLDLLAHEIIIPRASRIVL